MQINIIPYGIKHSKVYRCKYDHKMSTEIDTIQGVTLESTTRRRNSIWTSNSIQGEQLERVDEIQDFRVIVKRKLRVHQTIFKKLRLGTAKKPLGLITLSDYFTICPCTINLKIV